MRVRSTPNTLCLAECTSEYAIPIHTQTRSRPLLLQMFGLANVNDASLATPVVLVAHGRTVLTMRLSKVGMCHGTGPCCHEGMLAIECTDARAHMMFIRSTLYVYTHLVA
jgi:hypothetical protein